jgi:fructose-specific phosphotransferase system IIC component
VKNKIERLQRNMDALKDTLAYAVVLLLCASLIIIYLNVKIHILAEQLQECQQTTCQESRHP